MENRSCKFCDKKFTSRQSRFRHEKSCSMSGLKRKNSESNLVSFADKAAPIQKKRFMLFF